MTPTFDQADLLDTLDHMTPSELDSLAFGVIVMDRRSHVVEYNAAESELSGRSRERVVGEQFFESVGPCTNNLMVAQHFVDEPDLDAVIEYVFTFRMRPTPVRLRLLGRADSDRRYLVVERR
jgi:photoactive yellow protein